jgi:hypothetical protein
MAVIQLAIEGKDAESAARDLVTIGGIEGNWTTDETEKKEGVVTAIATIVAIVGGTIAIAEQIRQWYQEYKQGKSGKTVDKVLIVCNGQRLLLENASVAQICQVLETCLEQ